MSKRSLPRIKRVHCSACGREYLRQQPRKRCPYCRSDGTVSEIFENPQVADCRAPKEGEDASAAGRSLEANMTQDKYGGSSVLREIAENTPQVARSRTISVVAAVDMHCVLSEDEAINDLCAYITDAEDMTVRSVKVGVANLEWLLNALDASIDRTTGWIQVGGIWLERGPDQHWRQYLGGK